jgi:hypothetical protein
LEDWKTTVLSTGWSSCTSVGGAIFFVNDSVSQVQTGENEDNQGFNSG